MVEIQNRVTHAVFSERFWLGYARGVVPDMESDSLKGAASHRGVCV